MSDSTWPEALLPPPFYDDIGEYDMTKEELRLLNDLAKQIDGIAISTTAISTVLIGIKGTQNGGVVKQVEKNTSKISSLNKWIYIAVGIGIGSGIIGGFQFFV